MPERVTTHMCSDFLRCMATDRSATPRDICEELWVRRSTAEHLVQACEQLGLIIEQPDPPGHEMASPALANYCKSRLTRQFCRACEGRGIVAESPPYYAKYLEILKRRPRPVRSEDQYQASPASMVARVSYLIGDHAITRKKVLLLGDDDFTSIGLALYGEPQLVTVLDIEPETLRSIDEIAKECQLPIVTIRHNLFHVLPKKHVGAFDSFFGDPPYEYGGLLQWLQRGLESLRPGGRGYLACPFHDYVIKSKNYLYTIQQFLNRNGFAVTDMIHGFHTYEGNDNQRSSMLRCEAVKEEEIPEAHASYFWSNQELKLNRPIIDKDVLPFLRQLYKRFVGKR